MQRFLLAKRAWLALFVVVCAVYFYGLGAVPLLGPDEPRYAEVARANLELAGVAELVQLRAGRALESLRELIAEKAGPFDLIFIDADKQGTPEYFSAALELSRAGTVIVTDNVVRAGAIVDAGSGDERVEGMRRFHELLAGEPRASATTIQTVGGKGYDGFTLALVEGEP